MPKEWVVSLVQQRGDSMQIAIPAELGRGFKDRGYNKVRLTLLEEGIMLVPFHDEYAKGRNKTAWLPDWSEA